MIFQIMHTQVINNSFPAALLYIALHCSFWMDHYPEDFKSGSALLDQLSSLQQAMTSANDKHLLEMISSDRLLVLNKLFMIRSLINSCCLVQRSSSGFRSRCISHPTRLCADLVLALTPPPLVTLQISCAAWTFSYSTKFQ